MNPHRVTSTVRWSLLALLGADGNPSHGNTDKPLNPANPTAHQQAAPVKK